MRIYICITGGLYTVYIIHVDTFMHHLMCVWFNEVRRWSVYVLNRSVSTLMHLLYNTSIVTLRFLPKESVIKYVIEKVPFFLLEKRLMYF